MTHTVQTDHADYHCTKCGRDSLRPGLCAYCEIETDRRERQAQLDRYVDRML